MTVIVKKNSAEKAVSNSAPSIEEVNVTLNKIFDSASDAIKKKQQRVTLEHVDKTLAALFDAVNQVHLKGSKVDVPDFQKILSETRH